MSKWRETVEGDLKRIAHEVFTEENFADPAATTWELLGLMEDPAGEVVFAEARCSDADFGYERLLFVLPASAAPSAMAVCTPAGEGWELHSTAGDDDGAWRECQTALDLLGAPSPPSSSGCLVLLALLGAGALLA